MSYEKIARLVHALSEKTIKQEITWNETEKEGTYETSFPKSSVRISEAHAFNREGDHVNVIALELINHNGDVIEKVNDEDLREFMSTPYATMRDMYNCARRQAMGVEAALDEILNIIDSEI